MFGVDTTEFLIVAVAALIFIGPKELPGAMRTIGRWVGQARAHARHFTSGIENMMREAELEEMEKRWREENERIMREHPVGALPFAGASTGETQGPAGSAPNGPPPSPEVSGVEVSEPPARTLLDDEPSLPLPQPDNRRRELP